MHTLETLEEAKERDEYCFEESDYESQKRTPLHLSQPPSLIDKFDNSPNSASVYKNYHMTSFAHYGEEKTSSAGASMLLKTGSHEEKHSP